MSGHKVHRSLLHMELLSCRLMTVSILTRVHWQKCPEWGICEHRNWTTAVKEGCQVGLITFCFTSCCWPVPCALLIWRRHCTRMYLKDLLLMDWRQMPQHAFRSLVEFTAPQVRAVLAAKGESTQY